MKIKSITLTNYRNYDTETFNFDDGLNILLGKNAQGKTNALEAVYYCAIGKSIRTQKDKDLVNFLKEQSKITLEVQKKFQKIKIEIFLSKKMKKTIKINHIPIKRIGELFGEFNAVYFSPDELKLVKEAPEDRRRFIDIHISQTDKNYFYLLTKYEKILLARNKLLKLSKDITQTIGLWDIQLSLVASKIILKRIDFLKKIAPIAKQIHEILTDEKEILTLEYVGITAADESALGSLIQTKLADNYEKDFNLGFTSIGPHRDDIKIKVNDIDIRNYGSQGQQRTVALSLKLAELEIMKAATCESPVLLLDDVLSELDSERKQKLIKLVNDTQTLITCTEFKFDNIKCKKFYIENGKIKNNNQVNLS